METKSYGIILYYKDSDSIKYLISQSKDTIEYNNIIRGYYNNNHLPKYISLMTTEEKYRILNYSFDDLWEDLWYTAKDHDVNKYSHIVNNYKKAKHKYSLIIERLKVLIYESLKEISMIQEPSWGFPKGRRLSNNEAEIETAFREFHEETGILLDSRYLDFILPITEIKIGSNEKKYILKYFICKAPEKFKIQKKWYIGKSVKIRTKSYYISNEIADLKWLTLKETKKYLSPVRYEILEKIERQIH